MIQSMTAFARKDLQAEWGSLSWEIRAVNHRYLELFLRLPEDLRPIENKAREIGRNKLGRGKVECGLRFSPSASSSNVQVDEALARKVAQAAKQVAHLIDNPDRVNPMELLSWPGVIQTEGVDTATIQQQALELYKETVQELIHTRAREGERLKEMIQQRCDALRPLVEQAKVEMPKVIEQTRDKLRERLQEFLEQADENRLEQEIALQAQKLDIDEEMDRLTTHLDEVERVINKGGAVGRRLDFLMQELHREANTLGSKSAYVETTRIAVEMKVLIEQMREQVQNIE
jgi:uncharacterized protein (TIGR00255 family)